MATGGEAGATPEGRRGTARLGAPTLRQIGGRTVPAPILRTEPLERTVFVDRPNRFVVRLRRGRRTTTAYIPNPGKLQEILLPGTELLVARRPGTVHGLEVVAATWHRRWPGDLPRTVFLNPGRMNHLAARLLERHHVPELSSYRLVRTEPRIGGSRFDALLERDGEELFLEVKSVTLTERGIGMFPDARSERGARHLRDLGELARGRRRAAVLFLVQGRARQFLPDFHNDVAFARELLSVRRRVAILPYRIRPTLTPEDRLVFTGRPQRLEIPRKLAETGCTDRGLYLLVLELHRPQHLRVGALGTKTFERGFHVYTGSAARSLSQRLARHLRRRKRAHWHVDDLRNVASRGRVFPIRSASNECRLAADLRRIADDFVAGFGSSDCRCPGHLAWFESDPVRNPAFQRLLTNWRHAAIRNSS